jgi:hypothetical protein
MVFMTRLTAPRRPAVLENPVMAGAKRAAMMAMMAITVSNSTKEKPPGFEMAQRAPWHPFWRENEVVVCVGIVMTGR